MFSFKLDELVNSGMIKSYSVSTFDMDGNLMLNPGRGSRETDRLELVFPNGTTLTIDTFCSGSMENTVLLFK